MRGRKQGSKNKQPTRSERFFVRMTPELAAWVRTKEGKSASDRIVRALEAQKQNEREVE